ncbi:hypothetical protein MTO96_026177 [Rhipicephalus appendiculatus]
MRVCIGCGALQHKIKMLPCRHILCSSCRDKHLVKTTVLTGDNGNSGKRSGPTIWCPVHRTLRPASRVLHAVLLVERVRRQIAFCPNSAHGCPFMDELGQVEKHYATCRYRAPVCRRCRRFNIPAADFLLHDVLCGRR